MTTHIALEHYTTGYITCVQCSSTHVVHWYMGTTYLPFYTDKGSIWNDYIRGLSHNNIAIHIYCIIIYTVEFVWKHCSSWLKPWMVSLYACLSTVCVMQHSVSVWLMFYSILSTLCAWEGFCGSKWRSGSTQPSYTRDDGRRPDVEPWDRMGSSCRRKIVTCVKIVIVTSACIITFFGTGSEETWLATNHLGS